MLRKSRAAAGISHASAASLALVAMAATLVGAGALRADEPLSTEEKEAGFKSLFNGKDFTGWRFSGGKEDGASEAPNWMVKDGVIQLSGGSSPHLATDREYTDFELRLQWRALRDKYNSGLYIRSGKKVGANQINLVKPARGYIGLQAEGAPIEFRNLRLREIKE
jgi:hypothetical protein